MDILNQFGVKPVLLAAQAVNFLVLLYLLNRFLYKPILEVLKKRQQTIAQSLENASEIEKKLKQTEQDRDKKLIKASDEAKQIINEATESANQIILEARKKASEDMGKIALQAKQGIELEREKMRQELRAELANLVALGLEKVTGKILTQKDQKEMVEKTVKGLS